MNKRSEFLQGLRHGIPICIAYIAVSFTFGLMCVKDGLPVWLAVLISGSNLTSAGQFAGLELMQAMAAYAEIAVAVFVINLRYALMSTSLSQQLPSNISPWTRFGMSFFVTDEVFAVATAKGDKINAPYFFGLAFTPYVGWLLGTLLGGLVGTLLPETISAAAGIAIYCMFIAIIVPPARKSLPITATILIAVALSCSLYFIPIINKVSFGWRIIISSVAAAALTAWIFPIKDEDPVDDQPKTNENKEASDL